ncbi:hypothetical protein [Pseudodonghicola xiamenensis]|uniref:Uncharacterized protein n=1 Tax=Pseudodonghicola xiamenensis TaxID=337702 RepID=A0A8J3MEJ4_9RHOB|nr:hypothetical protein [Pseudodonghicola xiamenensis]GHG89148.1 hypothetical protein GCM10010961_18760 [Pseudodonghicola xiamenensis]
MTRRPEPTASTAETGAFRRLALVLFAALALVAAAYSDSNPLTRRAEGYARTVAVASAGVYVTLRTLNAVLSAAQEIEVGGSMVVSGTAQPLKLLEPIDDTVERVAGGVFALMVTTGILSVSMAPVGAVGFGLLALGCGLAALGRGALQAPAQRLGWYGGSLAVMLPLAFVLSGVIADPMTQAAWDRNMAVIEDITAQVNGTAPTATEPGGWGASLRSALGEVDRYQELARNLYTRADEMVGSFVAIFAIFVFKLFVLPLLLLGACWGALRSFARPAA